MCFTIHKDIDLLQLLPKMHLKQGANIDWQPVTKKDHVFYNRCQHIYLL